MPQTILSTASDGKTRILELPDLTDEQIRKLGWALENVRALCVISPYAFHGVWADEFKNFIRAGYPFSALCGNMTTGRDLRKDIVNIPNFFFEHFIKLCSDTAQTSDNFFGPFQTVLQGFGLMGMAEGADVQEQPAH